MKKTLWILLSCSIGIIAVGLLSDLYLGDEIYHFRFARDIYRTGERVTYDPFFGKGFTLQTHYQIPPLWHLCLAFLWTVAGGVSFAVAQVYHALYFVLLLVAAYFLGKELYGEREAHYSLILAGTVPMIISFSILFYVDMPLTALTALTLLLILKKRHLGAGLGFGLMCFTKFNGFFFFFPFVGVIFYLNYRNRWLLKILAFSLASMLIIIPDLYWRETHFGTESHIGSLKNIMRNIVYRGYERSRDIKIALSPGEKKSAQKKAEGIRPDPKEKAVGKPDPGRVDAGQPDSSRRKVILVYNSSFTNIKDNVKYFGLGLPFLLILYLMRRRFEKKDIVLWGPILFYFLLFLYFFKPSGDIRYLLPIAPLLCIVASKPLASWGNRKGVSVLLAICLIQFVSVLVYVYTQRQISPEMDRGIGYIKMHTPEDARIVYPEYNLTEYTNRRVVWTTTFWDLGKVLWGSDEMIRDALKKNHIRYILIKKTRVYDDKDIHHTGGYPKSFVDRLPGLSFLELIFENDELSLWRLEKDETEEHRGRTTSG